MSHSTPNTSVGAMAALKPTSGVAPNRSPMAPMVPSPRSMVKFWRAASASPIRTSSHRTASRPAQPASSVAPATARCRSGRRNPAPSASAPVRVTDSGITVRAAFVSAMAPASPVSSMVPPTAVTRVAATTRG